MSKSVIEHKLWKIVNMVCVPKSHAESEPHNLIRVMNFFFLFYDFNDFKPHDAEHTNDQC